MLALTKYIKSEETPIFDNFLLPWARYFNIKNTKHEIIAISTDWSRKIGFKNPIDILGTTAYDMRCPAVDLAEQFCSQDKLVISENIEKRYLMMAMSDTDEIHPHIYQKNKIGSCIISNHTPITPSRFSRYFYNRVISIDKKYYRKLQNCYELVKSYDGLSAKESLVLYYLMVGMNSSEIGSILNLSKRTIQHYVERIKPKYSCASTQHLIELGLYLSLNNKIPESLLV